MRSSWFMNSPTTGDMQGGDLGEQCSVKSGIDFFDETPWLSVIAGLNSNVNRENYRLPRPVPERCKKQFESRLINDRAHQWSLDGGVRRQILLGKGLNVGPWSLILFERVGHINFTVERRLLNLPSVKFGTDVCAKD